VCNILETKDDLPIKKILLYKERSINFKAMKVDTIRIRVGETLKKPIKNYLVSHKYIESTKREKQKLLKDKLEILSPAFLIEKKTARDRFTPTFNF
jgi:hypothetical protein